MKLFLGICLLAISFSFKSQPDYPLFEKRWYVNDGDTLLYRIQFPMNYSKDKKYPVVVFLHGAGERGNDNQLQLVHGGALFADSIVRSRFPAFVIFPQCPSTSSWVGYKRNFNADSVKRRIYLEAEAPIQRPLELVKLLLDSLTHARQVDTNRIYLGGLSMGGFGTFDLLQRYPTFFAAAFPICGGGRPEDVAKYSKHVPLWIFHGAKDDIVHPDWSREMVKALKQAGADVRYTEYPDVNHNSWDSAFAEPQLLSWLFSQSKK